MKVYDSQTERKPKTIRTVEKGAVQLSSLAGCRPAKGSPMIQVFHCPVCTYIVKTGDSVELKNGDYCHYRCLKYIERSGQLKPPAPHEGARTVTPKQREANIKLARGNVQRTAAQKTLGPEVVDARKNEKSLSLVDYLIDHE